ncbi:hypothetical protein DT603_12685 [Pseudoxanthomonas gei]|uniref:Uncharacterized protein n=2 Tax=Pseudoxanthomonas gei TaxID=1383030 RepID=A0ABX0AKE2_9GAMM|nr:hypothetical protein [Pseudoxanthomonas gei]
MIRLLSGLIALGLCFDAPAYVVTISPGVRAVYLRVGTGTSVTYNSNVTTFGNNGNANNNTINIVSVVVPANVVGNGANRAMTSNSSQGTSSLDSYAFCDVPAEIYIGGFYRLPGNSGTATLTATVPTSLTNSSGQTIPFSQISWTSSGNGDTGAQPILAGTFTPGSQTLASFPVNTWRESCHSFAYGNDAVVAAGTFTGQVTYTLSAP